MKQGDQESVLSWYRMLGTGDWEHTNNEKRKQ